MHLSDTMPSPLLANIACKQHNALNIKDLGGYCAANNPFQVLTYNHFRSLRKVSECVICRQECLSVPLWKKSNQNYQINSNS